MYAGFAGRKNQSQKYPVHLSSLLALRAICSFKQCINKLMSIKCSQLIDGCPIMVFFGIGATYQWDKYPNEYSCIYQILMGFIIWVFPLSRANEVFYSFLQDAIEKVNGKPSRSDLMYGDRIKLALKSYVELILDFALIYYLLPSEWFTKAFESIWDSIYFSGVTITTLGYGDYSPLNTIPKLLTVYEVLCGFILIVVSFAIYTGRGLEIKNE